MKTYVKLTCALFVLLLVSQQTVGLWKTWTEQHTGQNEFTGEGSENPSSF